MSAWRKLISVMSLFVLLYGCKDSNIDGQNNDGQKAASETQSQPFDLQKVQQDYQGVGLTILDISEREREGRSLLAITLSVPLDPSVNHQEYFQVLDNNRKVVDGLWILSDSGKVAYFNNTLPNKGYLVQVYDGLTAANGASLSEVKEQWVKTRDLPSAVSFNSDGDYLVKGISQGLPVVTVNVPEVNIDFFRVEDAQIQRFLSRIDGYYWRMDELTQFAELVYSGRFDLDAPKNTRTERVIDVEAIQPLQQSGIYLAILQGAGQYNNQKALWFTVTDLGLHARFYQGQIDVHVSSLNSGKALADVEVSLYSNKNSVLKTVKSNAQGVASFTGVGTNVRLIGAKAKNQFSIIQTRKPALDLSQFDLGNRPQLPIELFIYAPRDLYRPGEVIDFNALIRDGDGKGTKAAVLNAKIVRPDGIVASRFQWQAENLDYYYQPWQIPTDAPVGNWQLKVKGPFQHERIYSFKVEEFLPERMKLTFNHGKSESMSVPGDRLFKLPVSGEYLYGAPGSGNRVSAFVDLSHWRSPIESLETYQFGDVKDNFGSRYREIEDISLSSGGEGVLSIDPQLKGNRSPLRLQVVASLYESGGRPVTRSHSVLVWPKPQLLGIRGNFEGKEGDGNPKANTRVKFDIVKASKGGQLFAAKNLEVKLIKEDRQYFWVHSNSQGWHYDWTEKEFIEGHKTLDIAKGEHGSVEFPVNYGRYRLEVSEPGKGLLSSIRFFAGDDWYARWQDVSEGNQGAHPDKVTMVLDKQAYKAGDFATVNIVPPYSGEAIVMVEGDGPLWMKRIYVDEAGTKVEIPVGQDWQQHNLYVTAVVLRPVDGAKFEGPKRSFGMVHLPLNRQNRKLEIAMDVPEKWLPQQTVDVKLNVNGHAPGKPVYLTLAAVDVGVLSVSNFATPDPFEHFFGRRAYSVQSRDVYDQLIALGDYEKAKLRFGGDGDLAKGGKRPQSDVQIVSLFQKAVAVENGEVTVQLQLPDFNGRLRLMALAFGAETFGHLEQEVTVASPVVTQISLPRFLARGDKSTVALDISNLSGLEQNLKADFSVTGPVTMKGQQRAVSLKDQEKTTLLFDVEATGVDGQAQFKLSLSGLEVDAQTSLIERSWGLGVRPAYPAVTRARRASINAGEVFALDGSDVEGLLQDTVQAQLSLSDRVDLNLASQLNNLLSYPYGCLEQTSSRAFVLAFANTEQQQKFNLTPLADNERLKRIQAGIERVASMQLKNGGFGLWSNRSSEEHWLTAYVADFLLNAESVGIDVPYELKQNAINRLREYISYNGRYVDERYSGDPKHYNFAYKAYAAYVLSRVHRARLSSLRKMFDKQFKDARTGLPQLHLGLALYRMGDKKRGQVAIDKGLKAIEIPKEVDDYLGDYGSLIRDRALAIHLLLTNEIAMNEAIALSEDLADDLRNASWLSTQERNALFLAGIALAQTQNTQWSAELLIAAQSKPLKQTAAYSMGLDAQTITEGLEVKSTHSSPLFVNAQVIGYGVNKPEPVSEGLSISRQWYDVKGNPVAPEKVQVGEIVIVHLQVKGKKRTPDALVVDLLPSGFELENQNLSHAVKLDSFKIDGVTLDNSRSSNIKHLEYRDDRFIAAIDVDGYQASNLYYLMRAVTPGQYIVPAPFVEDMYKPQVRAIGETIAPVSIENVSR